MDILADNNTLTTWLIEYGSIVLFCLLALGIIALPVPEETLMILAGILMHHGKLSIPFTILAALFGSICGISMSYVLGRTAGNYLLIKYGSWIGITKKRLNKAHQWFERFGKWALFIGYFIPGIRHFTGFTAGSSYLKFRYFALFAYMGALFWVFTFLSIGYFLGRKWFDLYEQWFDLYEQVEISIDIITLFIVLAAICFIIYAYKRLRR
ncbi:MAG: DedA family protein [Chlamydiales bacterium]|nr:DedA family protein [Chlamydiales bacterium]